MLEKKLIPTEKPQETCVLVGLVSGRTRRDQAEEYLDELAFLAETANAITRKTFANFKTYIARFTHEISPFA